jgi:hypothetical protein
MIRKIGKTSLVLALVGALAVLACMSCGGDDDVVVGGGSDTYDAVVCFRVNAAGTAFENIGSSKDGSVKYAATPQRSGGAFESNGQHKVYNTKGTQEGEYWVPWMEHNPAFKWKRYINVGIVDLGANTGDLLASLNNWTVETIFALPSDHPLDLVDQFVWSFVDAAPVNTTMIASNWREMYLRVWKPAPDQWDVGGLDWVTAEPYRPMALGQWAHLVVTKTSGGAITTYINGAQVSGGTISFPTFAAGELKVNSLGKTPHMDTPLPDDADNCFGMDLANTKYFHFAIDNKAWSASEVTTRYNNSHVGKGYLVSW